MVFNWIGDAITGITSIFTGNTELKKVRSEGQVRLEEARIKGRIQSINKAAESEGNYDVEAQRQMQYSIKDEILLIILFLPFIAGFIPYETIQQAIIVGWDTLNKAPAWYPVILIGIVCSVFGLRWYASKIPK